MKPGSVDEAGQDQAAGAFVARPAGVGGLGLDGFDAAVLDQQPVLGAPAHRGRRGVEVGVGRAGRGDVQQVTEDSKSLSH